MSGSSPAPPSGGGPARTRLAGFELKLEQGRAVVRLGDQLFLPGIRLADIQLEVPGVRFPFDITAGASQFRQHLCDLLRIELHVDAAGASALAARVSLAGTGLADVEVALRAGFAEVAGRLEGGPAFTARVAVEPEGAEGLRLLLFAPRLYGAGPVPEPLLPFLLARAAAPLGRADGASLVIAPLAGAMRRLLPPRGWKLPRTAGARLALAAFEPGRLRLAWDREGAWSGSAGDPEWLATVEGTKAFAPAEALLEAGDAAGARDAWLSLGQAAADHPFAAARLLGLLSADERFHDEALDLSAAWLSRRPDFAPALLCEARLRGGRGETARASEAWAQLAQGAARRGEELSALAAADACLALGASAQPAAVARAVEVALSVRRDHLPALRALLALGERGGDREALLRACRRLAAYSTDEAEKAAAHATLGRLLLRADPAAARLHLDHALRLAPGQPDTAEALARACEEAGEPLRAVKAWDRVRDLRLAAGDRAGAARAASAVGQLWEKRLLQPENALLRYRDAADLDPSAEAHERAAALSRSLGHWAEAADRWAAVLGCTDPAAPGAGARAARARRELARIAEEHLADAARAADHLEAALELEPDDAGSLQRLVELYARLERPAERLGALDRLAARAPSPEARVRLLAEAARLATGPEDSRRRWEELLADAPDDPEALRGLVGAAAALGDDAGERRALSHLARLPLPAEEVAAVLDRLAAAWERSGGLPAALDAASEARRLLPTAGRLAAELSLASRLGGRRLADVHAEQAESLSASDPAAAAGAWLERARLLAGSDGDAALAALAEARLLAPGEAAVLEAQAHLAESHGDLSLALSALSELALQRPGDGRVASRMARAALAAGDRELAREQAERAVALGARGAAELHAEVLTRFADPRAAADRAALAAERSDPAERLALLRQALELDPESLAALTGLCAGALAPLAGSERLEWLARLAAHPEVSSAEAGAALLARARGLAAAGDRGGGLEAARQAARRLPGEPEALDLVAELAVGIDPAAAAEALLARATLAREAGDPDAALRLAAAGQEARAAGLPDGGRWALREALQAGLDREDAAGAWRTLAELAREAGDGAAEREALAALVPLLPTGEKPGALLRLAALHAEAGDGSACRQAAEQARRLAPRDAVAVEACLAAAEREHDRAAAAELLGELAELEPPTAGPRLLARARLLAGPLGRPEEADEAYDRAARLLPGDAALAAEQVRLRREAPPPVGDRPWGEPLELLARALPDREAALALRQAAELALQQGDAGAALRCARRAWERSSGEPALAGPLLARLLYRLGSRAEALALLRRLVREALPDLSDRAQARSCRQLAELAEDGGDVELARQALARLLERRPFDAEAAQALFRLDPDRGRAVRELAERASGWRSARARVGALARAAAAAHGSLADPALADVLWRRARGAAVTPRLLARVETLRAESLRADHDPADPLPPRELLEALDDAGAAQAAAGAATEAAALWEESAELASRHGLVAEELRARRHLAEACPGEAGKALALGRVAARAGDWAGAAAALARAEALEPDGPWAGEALAALPGALRAAGDLEGALAAARRRADRAQALGLAQERRAALDEVVGLARELDGRGAPADLLEPIAAALLADGDPRGDELAERALEALTLRGENARALALIALAARARTGGRRAAWLRRLAALAQARGDQAAALGALAEAVTAEPGDADLRESYLAQLEQAGDGEGLVRALRGALAFAAGDRADLLERLAKACSRLGDEAGAEEAERELFALGPGAAGWEEAAATLERRWRARGDERALAELLFRRAEAEPSSRGRAQRLAAAAEALLRAGAGGEARSAALRACEAEPDAPEPWRALASAEAAAGRDREAAAAHLAAALRGEAGEAADAAMEAARLFEAAGQGEEATRAASAAVAALPGCPPARRFLAARAAAAGDHPAAVRHLSALDRDLLPAEERPEHDRQLARALTAAAAPEAADAWAGLFETDASDPEAFEALASEALRAEDRERWLRLAARHDGALAAGDPVRRRDLRCARARVLAEMGQWDAAEGAWHAALSMDPEHRPALAALRGLLVARGDRASAADLAEREALLTADPADAARLHLEEARLRHMVADTPRTAEALEKAVKRALESPHPDAPAIAAEARLMLGEVVPPLVPLDEEVTARVTFAVPPAEAGAGVLPEPEPSETGAAATAAAEAEAPPSPERDEAPAAAAPALLAAGPFDPGPSTVPTLLLSEAPLPLAEVPVASGQRETLPEFAPLPGAAPQPAPAPPPPRPVVDPAVELAVALEGARLDPGDPSALALLATRCAAAGGRPDAARLGELGRVALGLAAFVEPDRPALPPPVLARRVVPSLRMRAAVSPAAGPNARLLALLGPWLEPLFPADLARRGVTPDQRLSPGRDPGLETRLAAAAHAFDSRVVIPFLAEDGGHDVALENTQPPSLVLGGGLVRELRDSAVSFALARGLCLLDLGWALIGKFAAPDVGVLCELACRFAGGSPPPMGFPPQRAGAFLEALGRHVPAAVRAQAAGLAVDAAAELARLSPRSLQLAVRRTASRHALLWSGDILGALEALGAARRRPGAPDPLANRRRLLAEPDLADLAHFALSDLYIDLRREEAETP